MAAMREREIYRSCNGAQTGLLLHSYTSYTPFHTQAHTQTCTHMHARTFNTKRMHTEKKHESESSVIGNQSLIIFFFVSIEETVIIKDTQSTHMTHTGGSIHGKKVPV